MCCCEERSHALIFRFYEMITSHGVKNVAQFFIFYFFIFALIAALYFSGRRTKAIACRKKQSVSIYLHIYCIFSGVRII